MTSMTRSTVLPTSRLRSGLAGLAAAALAVSGLALAAPAPVAQAAQDVVVSPTPATQAPRVANGRVYAIDTYGDLVVVGGSFTILRPGRGGADIPRQWIFMYRASTGELVDSFQPQLGGPAPEPTNGLVKEQPGVEAVQFAPDGQSVYVGGWFTSVNGTARNRMVRLNLDGSLDTTFNANINNTVMDAELVGGRLVVGGRFGQVNGQPNRALVALDPTTGARQTDFNLPATEARNQYGSFVREIDSSDDGRLLAVSGSFKKVGTAARNQLAVLDLSGTPSVANWSTDQFAPNCSSASTDAGDYIRGLAFSPDSSFLVVSTTGAYGGENVTCDTATRWEMPPVATGDNQTFTWRDHTGGDTLWAAEVTDAAVYVGGHQRWMNNPRPSPGGDNDGPGSVSRPGIAALDPLTGVPLSWNPGRDRGRGAEAIHATDDYLFVGHDTDLWGGVVRQRLAQLPVAGGTTNTQPTTVDLPVNLYVNDGSGLRRAAFDGATVGTPVADSRGLEWSSVRGAFTQAGKLFYFGAESNFYSRPFSDSAIGDRTNLSETVGYLDTNYNLTPDDQPYGVAETVTAAYQPDNGNIYYLKQGDSRLYQRGFSLQSGIIGSSEFVASTADWSGARALTFIGDWLYAAWNDGRLYRYYAPQGRVRVTTRTQVDGGSQVNWANARTLFATPGTGTAVPPTAPDAVTCSGSTPWRAAYYANTTLAGTPNLVRCEAAIDNDYGSGAPAGTGLPADNFSVEWSRQLDLTAPGSIRVDATTDDGVRAFVDGERVIDRWVDQGPTASTGTSSALEAGAHTVRIQYYERGGGAVARATTTVVDAAPPPPAPDNIAPDTAIDTPAQNEVLRSGALTSTGTASDNVGVTEVHVGVYNRDDATNRWLQPDGTWGPTYAYRQATVASVGATSTGWTLSGITLPEGSFALDARSFDARGNEDPDRAWRPFSVSTAPADTQAPSVAIASPAKNSTVATNAFTATGSASDDRGVRQVRVGIYNRATPSTPWLQADGTWGSRYAFRTADLGSAEAASSSWSIGENLGNGLYALDVKGVDTAGNVSGSTWWPFTVNAPTAGAAPTARAARSATTVKGSTVRLSGTATDDRAVSSVLVSVQRKGAPAARRWLATGQRFADRETFRVARLTKPGKRATDWKLALRLPRGRYVVSVLSLDHRGTVSRSASRLTVRVTR